MNASELAERITSGDAPQLIDARSGFEFKRGHIAGAIHAPFLKVLFKSARLPDDKDTELVITCEHGPRAMMTKRLLAAYGYRNTTLLDGHMLGWRRANLPMENSSYSGTEP
jgi:rhodanese-related sulfurtransferase